MTDEEAIALAMLMDATPWEYNPQCWYVRSITKPWFETHEVEHWWAHNEGGGQYFWRSREEAAHAVCMFYKLGDYASG